MGRPKAWLEHGGERLLHRVARLIADACETVVVVAAPGQALPRLPSGVVRIDDPPERAGHGPLAGALTGLLGLRDHELVYIGSSDAAWLTTRHVRHMLDLLADDDSRAAVVPESDEGGIVHAASGAVRLPSARTAAQALLAAGERALRRLYEQLDARRIPAAQLPDPEAVRACNEPSDWAAAKLAITGTGNA
jgi:molybdenum cofactor guanylyltransferase